MNDIALASTILVSMAATTAAVIGIAYLCTHKGKPSENNSEPEFSDSQQLNSKLNGEQNSKNKDKNASNLRSSFSPTPTELKPRNSNSTSNSTPNLNKNSSQIPKELNPKIKVTDTYTINGRKINLCRQKKCDCWAYAAAFVACLRGKGGDTVTLETGYFNNIVDNVMECDRWSFGDSEQVKAMLEIIGMESESNTIMNIETQDDVKNTLSGELKEDKYILIQISLGKIDCEKISYRIATGKQKKLNSSHWVVVCENRGEGNFGVYDSCQGKIVNMTAKQIFDMLPKCRQEVGHIAHSGAHTGQAEIFRIMDVIYA